MSIIAIRADASASIGTGHVCRCMTLAKELTKLGFQVYFMMRDLPGNMIDLVKQYGYQTLTLDGQGFHNWETDAVESIQLLKGLKAKPHWLIVDHYQLDTKWESELSAHVGKIMVIDDLANREHTCHIILDQNLYHNQDIRYHHLLKENTLQLMGPRYVLLRDEFLTQKTRSGQPSGHIKNVMIYYGGSDPSGETIKVITALSTTEYRHINFTVVVGNSCQQKYIIERLCELHENFHFYCQVQNISQHMSTTDLAIGACGSSTWERCYLGIPTLSTEIATNQSELSQILDEKGIIINLGWYSLVTPELIKTEFKRLTESPQLLVRMSQKAYDLIHQSGYLGASYVASLLNPGSELHEQANTH
ncbi:MAG: UDP-2,4-diacetamido-2,4,6-trideoxy-beta-L-altropyranose hydrolase [Gammaproteobacteria bacterium]|nr:UDP-2,4-diacetamido-2,4,6-trideoxy-beta-L-altropyranose hydrolase [Gammaproteobacteria bacterium]